MNKTYKKASALIGGMALSVLTYAQSEQMTYVNSEWVKQTPVVGSGIFHSASTIHDNRLIVTTKILNASGNTDIATIKYTENGDTLWMKSFGGNAGMDDYGIDVETTASGDVVVIGAAKNVGTDYDYTVLRYAGTDGALQWAYRWNGAANGMDVPTGIVLDGADNIYVTGGSADALELSDFATIKLSPSGTLEWASFYDYNDLHDAPTTIELKGASIIVAGSSAEAVGDWDFASLRLDMITGAITTSYRSDIAGATITEAYAMTTDIANNIYITGYAEIAGNKNIQTIKLDADLSLVWIANYEGVLDDISYDVAVDSSGNVYVAGVTQKAGGKQQAIMLKYDAFGTQLWQHEFGDIHQTNGATATRIAVLPDGDFFVTGTMEKLDGQGDYFFNHYSSDGIYLTGDIYQSEGVDHQAHDMSIDGDAVYITGLATTGGTQQTTIVKYVIGKRDLIPVTVDGIESHLDDEIIVRFNRNAVLHEVVDNEQKRFGELQDFVTPETITAMQSAYPNIAWNSAKTYKIFHGLKTTDSISISRQGFEVEMPPFWATFIVKTDGKDEVQIAHYLDSLAHPSVFYAHTNDLYSLTTDDPFYDSQHSLFSTIYPEADINVEPAWGFETGKDHISVGVFDSGIRYTHDDLGSDIHPETGKIRGGKDFYTLGDLASIPENGDPHGHGTKVAGVIGAFLDNGYGVAGIAGGFWPYAPGVIPPVDHDPIENKGVSLYGLRVVTGGGILTASETASALIEGAANTTGGYGFGLEIENCSFVKNFPISDEESYNLMYDAQRTVFRNGTVLVAGKGNNGMETALTPAYARKEFWTVAVGGSNDLGFWNTSASYGNGIDLVAPYNSELVYTTSNSSDEAYGSFSGTSSATAHVSGVAGLMLSHINDIDFTPSNLSPDDIEFLVQRYAHDISTGEGTEEGYDDRTGFGLLDAGNIMQHIDRNEYVIRHYYKEFTFDGSGSICGVGPCSSFYYGDEEHTPGIYEGTVHYITSVNDHTLNPGDVILDSWPLNSYTNVCQVAPLGGGSGGMARWESEMALSAVNLSTATLHGETYHFLLDPEGNAVDFWYPIAPGEIVKMGYTLHLKTDYASTGETEKAFELSCYPNPSNSEMSVYFILNEPSDYTIEIVDLQGKVVHEFAQKNSSVGQQSAQFDVSLLANGMYAIRLTIGETQYYEKFIKQ